MSALSSCGLISFISALVDSRSMMQGRSFFGVNVHSPEKVPEVELDTLVITSNQDKEHILEEFSRFDNRIPRVIFSGTANYVLTNDTLSEYTLTTMNLKLHKNARTTFALRKEMQESALSVNALCRKYGLSWKTVKKWKEAGSIEDKPSRPHKLNTTLTQWHVLVHMIPCS